MQVNVVLILALLCHFESTNGGTALNRLLESVEKATLFLRNEYKDFNLDGILGYQLLLDQIRGTLEKWRSKLELPIYRWLFLNQMEKQLHFLIKQSKYYLEKNDPQYFNHFKDFITDTFWIIPSSYNQTNPDLEYSDFEISEDCLIEEVSDRCITLLLGTWNGTGEPCVVSEPCKKIMTKHGCTDYSLSHQLLYFMVGKSKGCTNSLFLQEYFHYTNVFCANMMKTNIEIESNGYSNLKRDLFMENILLCGLSQYSDFYKSHWMDTIISWQDPGGCFGIDHVHLCFFMLLT
ncbi:UPF0764 protein C16orf89 homolog isoform 2-T2 [Discoglossus pictus]